MKKGIVGKKLGMTQLFDANGNVVPVTVIEAGPCVISQKKTALPKAMLLRKRFFASSALKISAL